MSSEESNKMSKKIPSRDSSFEEIWAEMDAIEPLTPPCPTAEDRYKEAKKSDDFIFGDYESFDEKEK